MSVSRGRRQRERQAAVSRSAAPRRPAPRSARRRGGASRDQQVLVWAVFGAVAVIGAALAYVVATGGPAADESTEPRRVAGRDEPQAVPEVASDPEAERRYQELVESRRREREAAASRVAAREAEDAELGAELAAIEAERARKAELNPLSAAYAQRRLAELRAEGLPETPEPSVGEEGETSIGRDGFISRGGRGSEIAGLEGELGRASAARPPAGATAGASSPGPRPALPVGANQLFTMVLSGDLGGRAVDPRDQETWGKLGYFMQREARRPHYLVFPDGGVPVVQRGGKDGKPRPEDARPLPIPVDTRAAPTYRMQLVVRARAEGGISLYGGSLASRYSCKVFCEIEQQTGEGFQPIARFTVQDGLTPAGKGGETQEVLLRKLYSVTLDKLVKRLQSTPPFGA